MELREALYTTRAMRRVAADKPIPPDVQAHILDAAIRVPNAGNAQAWRFIVVDDPEVRRRIALVYRETMDAHGRAYYGARTAAAHAAPELPESQAHLRVMRSADHLAANFEHYPLLLFALATDDPYSACLALWNAILAAREHGVGGVFTRMVTGPNTAALLGVPADAGWQIAAAATFGYPTGRWGVAERLPVESVTFSNEWGCPLGIQVDGPLYS